MSTRNIDPKVREEAELWFARRQDPAVREAEQEAFERWRDQDPEHAETYAQTQRLWDELAVLKTSARLRELASQAMASPAAANSPSPPPLMMRRCFGTKALLLAASFAAVAIAVGIWFNQVPTVQTFATALGEQRTETLADGTTLRLNTNSALDVRMSDRRRQIWLKRGEAAFDVAKDATRPFVVAAGDGTVTAIGTHFQVRYEANQVAVTLIEGRVQLARPAYREVEWLDPGQQATFAEKSSGIVRRNVDVQALTSWMSGRLEFRSTPLEQAVAELNRYSARKVRIGDPAINQVAVSGTFRTGDVDGVTAAFEAAFPVRSEVSEHEIVLLPR